MLIQTTNFRKDMDVDNFDVGDAPTGRIQGIFFGFFLLAFGMPFTFVPLLIFGDGSTDLISFPGLFMVLFTIPFVVAGLFVQFIGFSMIRLCIWPDDEKNVSRLNNLLGNQSLDDHQEYWRTDPSDAPVEAEQDPTHHSKNFWDTVES